MFSQKKPYSAVTVAVENLTGERFEEDDLSGIPDLVEAIKLQGSGPTEAARAIRKKLKYGSVHRQIRALVLLDGLIQNAGNRFQRTFADEMLLERLRVCGTDPLSDPLVKAKCQELFRSWAVEYKNVRGLERIAALYKELPRRKQAATQDKSKVLRETEENPFDADEEEDEAPPPAASSHTRQSSQPANPYGLPAAKPAPVSVSLFHTSTSKDKKSKKDKKGKKKGKTFNLEEEKESMKASIADSAVAATNLLNALKLINREHEQISDNAEAVNRFEQCKLLRRKILRYIQHVESEQWLGSLLHANDELVQALMTYEQLDRSIDADSDSDDEMAAQAHAYRVLSEKGKEQEVPPSLAGLHIDTTREARPAQPPRPQPPQPPQPAEEEGFDDDFVEEDPNDPFGDRNAVATPMIERDEPSWGRS
ncbi:putative vhs-containing protein [Coleophoma crateriformis]|uniref:Putative vhs-containing protein n=1 Tax=Coleophoma crateriformis TaxID=565419 RepID=A0A3D8SH55_9HELO|nr:putative vhs-containing protein [Coleophoma crateriformis]